MLRADCQFNVSGGQRQKMRELESSFNKMFFSVRKMIKTVLIELESQWNEKGREIWASSGGHWQNGKVSSANRQQSACHSH